MMSDLSPRTLKTEHFTFELPGHLIAQHPSAERGQSKLLLMNRKTRRLEHRMVSDLPDIIEKGTLMVFNNSRVRRARLYGRSIETGAEHEFLLIKKIQDYNTTTNAGTVWQAMTRNARRRKPGNRYSFTGSENTQQAVEAEIIGSDGEYCLLRFDMQLDDAWLDINGHVPLPPYIRRKDTNTDVERYQTVYSQGAGSRGQGAGGSSGLRSAAAPTAGLHFTEGLLGDLKTAGVETAFITLHVGLGTFLPVRAEKVADHKMHEETFFIDDETACRIEGAKAEGRKILAVGTTSVRCLESAWELNGAGRLERGEGSTSIFIYPGYDFKITDAMFTNFHTPGSTLLMLVSAFAGRDFILESYREAVSENYRFYSYGDACLIF